MEIYFSAETWIDPSLTPEELELCAIIDGMDAPVDVLLDILMAIDPDTVSVLVLQWLDEWIAEQDERN